MKKKRKGLIILTAVLIVITLAANIALFVSQLVLDKVFGTTSFVRNEEDVDRAIENSRATALNVTEEGIVLLQNDDDFLPRKLEKVNLFGWASYSPISCMVGSGAVRNDADKKISITAAFKQAGIEYNPAIETMYDGLGFEGTSSTRAGNADYHLYEAGKEDVDGIMENAKEFSDIAIITLGRVAGESTDVPYHMDEYDKVNGQSLGTDGKHYLELSDREEYLISAVCDNFDNVIVLLNNSTPFNLGYLEQFSQIKSVLAIGLPGDFGFAAVPEVLSGAVNPSGRLADTYAYEVLSAPAAQSPMFNRFTNYQMNNDDVHWVTYNEGIYVGYRYYETRYVGDDNVYSDEEEAEYQKAVKYPFGYGLSYTDFDWKVTDQRLGGKGETIEIDVEVTNTGDKAGKDVVELYYTAPYVPGGIEKSYVNLGAFAKTSLLEPGAKEIVTLSMNVDEMASYDYKGEGCYVLDEGNYALRLQTDAHRMKEGIQPISYTVNKKIVYKDGADGARSTDQTAAVNHFETYGIEFMSDKEDAEKSYLSRADWEGTWPDMDAKYSPIVSEFVPLFGNEFPRTYDGYEAEASQWLIDALDTTWWEDYDPAADYRNKYFADTPITVDTPYYLKDFPKADKSAPDYSERISKNDTVRLADMKTVEFDEDEIWDKFLGQMSYEEMMRLYQDAGYLTAPVESIGKSGSTEYDGPAGLSDYMSLKNNYSVCWPNAVTLCTSWNTDIVHQMGLCFGAEALAEGAQGLYAPAINLHRSPFGGRNGEYPSEDGVLAGKIFAAEVLGLRETGIVVYAKHYALNNQETLRDFNGLCTFANEQTIRELYLKPFELVIKEGESTGLMNSYNRIGWEWTGMSPSLQIDVTRNEFGFKGNIVTDFFIVGSWADNAYMSVQMALKSGTDLLMTGDGYEVDNPNYLQLDEVLADNYTQQALKTISKNVCYTQSRGALEEITFNYRWRYFWIAGNILMALVLAYLIFTIIKRGRKENGE